MPNFTTLFPPGFKPVKVPYELVIGLPDCKAKQQWPIYHYPGSSDKLIILPDGQLRHYIFKTAGSEPSLPHSSETYYDFPQGHYCMDKVMELMKLLGVNAFLAFSGACSSKIDCLLNHQMKSDCTPKTLQRRSQNLLTMTGTST